MCIVTDLFIVLPIGDQFLFRSLQVHIGIIFFYYDMHHLALLLCTFLLFLYFSSSHLFA